ncbi:MAG: hypothetical protein M3R70_11170 [Actinomycetota bacterium]|nr:hypothetical protein [Actinomycetota bacterium]
MFLFAHAPRPPSLQGWCSRQRQTAGGAVESEQRVLLDAPVVEFSEAGARSLGLIYWAQVERSTLGLMKACQRGDSLELCALGRWAVLLRFGQAEVEASPRSARCSYPISGGLLAQRPEGEIVFVQTETEHIELRSSIRNFFPRLAAREGEPDWTGALYSHVQSRIHVAISRRYFERLIEGRS